jgi:curved DNA-binding protein CbpA
LKDYFAILGVKPSADNSEIKQAYRKLAMNYHPDKHQQDPEKTILYDQIREAYETLTEPAKRDEYLKERWRQKAAGIKFEDDLISGDVILKKAIELNQQLRYADPDRLNESRVRNQFNQVISDEMIAILVRQNDHELNSTVVSILIDTLKPLSLALCTELIPQIIKIPTDDHSIKRCTEILKQKRELLFWEKRKIWIVLLLTIALCLAIAFLS